MATNQSISNKVQKTTIYLTVFALFLALLHLGALITKSYNQQVEFEQELKSTTANNPPPTETNENYNFTVSSCSRTFNQSEASCFWHLLWLPISILLLRKRKFSRFCISTAIIGFLTAHFWLWIWATQKSKENIESEVYLLKHFSGLNSILMDSTVFVFLLFFLISTLFIWQTILSIYYALQLRKSGVSLP